MPSLTWQVLRSIVTFCEDAYSAANGTHAIALLTDWREFAELDFKKIYNSMQKPAFVFDGRNLLNHKALFQIGFNVFPIGKSPMSHF